MTAECSVDGEWRSDVDIKRCGAYRYFESEHCLPLILCWSVEHEPVRTWTVLDGRRCPPDLAAHIRAGGLIRAFNAAFERLGFRWLAAHWGWPEPRLEQYRCTAVEGAAMSLPRRLDKIGDALGISAKKDKRGDKLIKFFSIPVTRKEVMPDEAESAQLRPLDARPPAWNEPGAHPAEFRGYVDAVNEHGPGDKLIRFFSIPKGYLFDEGSTSNKSERIDTKDQETTGATRGKSPLWNEPVDHPAEFGEYVEYCRQDVRAEQEVASRLIPLSDTEWRVYALNERVNDRGLRIDTRSARAAIRLVEKAKEEINREIAEVTGGSVTAVTQVARLKTWVAEQGLDLPSLDKETIDDALHDDALPEIPRRALELRVEGAKPSTDKLSAMLAGVSHDQRVRGVYLHHGAGQTGRFSSRRVQAHNLPKYRKCFEEAHLDATRLFEAIRSEDPQTLRDLYGPDLGRPLHLISDAVRSFIWADPGREFLVADYSSIEGRMAAWFAGEEWEVEAYRALDRGEGAGIYEMNAADIYQIPVAQVTKIQRKVGKVRALSCAYQTGPGGILKFARQEKTKLAPLFPALWEAASPTRRAAAERRRADREKRGDAILRINGREAWLAAELIKVSWRAQHPEIVKAWHALENAAIEAIRSPNHSVRIDMPIRVEFVVAHGFLWMRLPSGRCLAYGRPKLHAQVYAREQLQNGSWSDSERMNWSEAKERELNGGPTAFCGTKVKIEGQANPKIIVSGVNAQTENYTRFPVYAGSFFNNLVQGSARDVLVHGMLRAEEAGLEVNLSTHDEIGCEVWRGSADPAWFERLICDLPPWCAGLPLTAKAFVSKRYRKD